MADQSPGQNIRPLHPAPGRTPPGKTSVALVFQISITRENNFYRHKQSYASDRRLTRNHWHGLLRNEWHCLSEIIKYETEDDPLMGYHQIIGHTNTKSGVLLSNHYGPDTSITWVDCLDTETEFFKIEI